MFKLEHKGQLQKNKMQIINAEEASKVTLSHKDPQWNRLCKTRASEAFCHVLSKSALFFFSSQHGVSDPPLLAVSEQSRRSHDHLSGQEVEGFPVSPLQAVLCEWPPHIKQRAHLAFVEIQSCVEFFSLVESNMLACFFEAGL